MLGETRLSAWVSCNRPGAQLAATVVLPRAIDPETGEPRRLLIRSNKNGRGGDWEQLDFSELAKELPAQARVARAHFGGAMDERGAYVSQLVILAPGGPGNTDLWVDQIAMYGVLNVGGNAPGSAPNGVVSASPITPAAFETAAANATPAVAALSGKPPAVPRIIQWQGEPLEFLQKLGFDAVWMGRPPIDSEIADGAAAGNVHRLRTADAGAAADVAARRAIFASDGVGFGDAHPAGRSGALPPLVAGDRVFRIRPVAAGAAPADRDDARGEPDCRPRDDWPADAWLDDFLACLRSMARSAAAAGAGRHAVVGQRRNALRLALRVAAGRLAREFSGDRAGDVP